MGYELWAMNYGLFPIAYNLSAKSKYLYLNLILLTYLGVSLPNS